MSELAQLLAPEIWNDLSTIDSQASDSSAPATSPSKSPTSAAQSDEDIRSSSLGQLRRFLKSSRFSDLTLRYEGHEACVHKIVLCAQSSWFAKACEGAFKEASQSTITLHDDDADAIEAMLSYCYGGSGLPGPSSIGASRLTSLVGTYSVADKYDLPGLRNVVALEFQRELKEQWMQLWSADELSFVVIAVYSCSPDPRICQLCQTVVELLQKNLQAMERQDIGKFRSLMEENPEMAADLVLRLTLAESSAPKRTTTAVGNFMDDDGLGACPIEQAMTPLDDQGGFPILAASCGIRVL